MVETDDLPVLLVNNFYDDDENSNRKKDVNDIIIAPNEL